MHHVRTLHATPETGKHSTLFIGTKIECLEWQLQNKMRSKTTIVPSYSVG